MARLYTRTSEDVMASEIGGPLRSAVEKHAREHQLGDILGTARYCCSTTSVRLKRPGLLARLTGTANQDTELRTVVMVTRHHLVVAVAGERLGTLVSSARLDGLSVTAERSLAIVDFGATVTGVWSGTSVGASRFLGLSDDLAGHTFVDRLSGAVAEAKTG
ncbi:hypothetical protein ACFWFF_11445 [Streptomyces sp. NPDC060223]|uniref:hypothetical protein n=1 Tax=unclassified Streptomyces TaxID=2593676 RepID=UPI0036367FC0